MDVWGPIALALVLSIFGLGIYCTNSKRLVEEWAKRNHYVLIRCEHRESSGGSLFWRTCAEHTWTVRVTDRDVKSREGWIRCFNEVPGLLPNRVDVRWFADHASESGGVSPSNPRDL